MQQLLVLELHYLKLLKEHRVLVTIEDGAIGGFAAQVNDYILKNELYHGKRIKNLFLPDKFLPHANLNTLYQKYTDLNHASIFEIIKQVLNVSNIRLANLDTKILESLSADVAQG